MQKLLFLSAIAFAAACGGKSSSDTTTTDKMTAMTCDAMADNVKTAMLAEHKTPEDMAAHFRDVFADQCTSTGWSQESIDCMGAAANQEDGEACEASMTADQKASLEGEFNNTEGGMDESKEGGMEGGME